MNLDTQFLTLVTMVGAGVFVTAMYDTYKLLLRPKNYWNRVVVDTLFLIVMGSFVFYLLYLSNGGILRFYLFLAVLLGISTYFALLQPIYISILHGIIRSILFIYRIVKQIIETLIVHPLLWLLRLLLTIVLAILSLVWKTLLFICRCLVVLLRPFIPKSVQKYLLNLLAICSRIVYKLKKDILKFWNRWRRKDGESES